jgi:hypothetical protein
MNPSNARPPSLHPAGLLAPRTSQSDLSSTRLGWNAGWEATFAPHRERGLKAGRVAVQDKHPYVLFAKEGVPCEEWRYTGQEEQVGVHALACSRQVEAGTTATLRLRIQHLRLLSWSCNQCCV